MKNKKLIFGLYKVTITTQRVSRHIGCWFTEQGNRLRETRGLTVPQNQSLESTLSAVSGISDCLPGKGVRPGDNPETSWAQGMTRPGLRSKACEEAGLDMCGVHWHKRKTWAQEERHRKSWMGNDRKSSLLPFKPEPSHAIEDTELLKLPECEAITMQNKISGTACRFCEDSIYWVLTVHPAVGTGKS